MEQFKHLCSQAFTARPLKTLALVSHKSLYKTQPLEAALESAFDPESLLFGGPSQDERSHIKVAVTATSAAENRPVIITNYNRAGPDRDRELSASSVCDLQCRTLVTEQVKFRITS